MVPTFPRRHQAHLSVLFVLLLGGHGAWALYRSFMLKPALDSINLSFPHDHAFSGIREHMIDFLASGTQDHAPASFLLGIHSYDRHAVASQSCGQM